MEDNEMIFYEFVNNSYYALVGVRQKFGNRYVKALKLYHKHICDEEFSDFLEFHGKSGVVAIEVTKEYAFNKFILSYEDEEAPIKKVIKEFNDAEKEDETIFLIDGSLL